MAFSGKFHLFTGIIAYLYLALGNEQLGEILNPLWLCVGVLFPDSDHRKAPMGRIFPLWVVCKHRRFTHSLQALALFSFAVGFVDIYWGVSFGLGYVLHLFFDAMTPSGVKWWWKRKTKEKRKNPLSW